MIEPLRKRTVRRHPQAHVLSRYLDGELAPSERRRLNTHLGDCPDCRRVLDSLAHTRDGLASLPAEPRADLADSIIAALRLEAPAQDAVTKRASRAWGSPALRLVGDGARQSNGNRAYIGRRLRLRPALGYCLRRAQLRLTVPMALLVGSVLSVINQGDMIFTGRLSVGMCVTCAMNFLVPFVALNIGLVMALGVAKRRRL
jgi:anti-sigma factor RsiW